MQDVNGNVTAKPQLRSVFVKLLTHNYREPSPHAHTHTHHILNGTALLKFVLKTIEILYNTLYLKWVKSAV